MRFLMLMRPDISDEADWQPSAEDVAAMRRYNEELAQAGALLALDGLHPSSEGARVAFTGATPSITDGPFAEMKEVVGGYWIIRADSKQEAVAWAARCPAREGDVIEVRRIYELSDFPQDVQDAAALSRTPPEQTGAA
ncbi:MAG TPA: YciI family protein [Solirubrobacteraceae bacterium]|nr:YciI family protein [Solirubrobacteraceae bacterium]